MEHVKILRANIGAELGRRDLSQAEVGAAIGISQAAFSARLHGVTDFRLSELLRLAVFLHTPLHTLLAGLDNGDDQSVSRKSA